MGAHQRPCRHGTKFARVPYGRSCSRRPPSSGARPPDWNVRASRWLRGLNEPLQAPRHEGRVREGSSRFARASVQAAAEPLITERIFLLGDAIPLRCRSLGCVAPFWFRERRRSASSRCGRAPRGVSAATPRHIRPPGFSPSARLLRREAPAAMHAEQSPIEQAAGNRRRPRPRMPDPASFAAGKGAPQIRLREMPGSSVSSVASRPKAVDAAATCS